MQAEIQTGSMYNTPTTPNETTWRVISRGVAAENLKLDGKELEIFSPEITGWADGEITPEQTEYTTKGNDDRGNFYTTSIKTSNTLKATWRQQGTNRITPPNVRRGERVEIWQFGNVDKYYWSTTGEDDHLRRRETVTHAYSNTVDETTKELTPENSYFTQINTHEKVVTLISTSKSDGEDNTHLLQIDTAKGIFNYSDDKGNYIQVETKDNIITLENADGAKFILDKRNAHWDVPDTINVKCKSYNVQASDVNVTASSISETAGNKTVNANVSTNGTLTNNGTNISSTHTHGGVKPGGSSTSTPS